MKNSVILISIITIFVGLTTNQANAQYNLVQPTSITGTAALFTGSSVPTDIIVDPIVTPFIDPTATTVSSYSDGSAFNNVYIWRFTANTITMNFGAPVDITDVVIWNAFASGAYADPGFLEPDHSVNLANFEFFSGGVSLGDEDINVLFPDDAFGEVYPLVGDYDDVDEIVMTVITNHGGNETAMQEIAFNTVICEDLTMDISATEICLGESVTLDGTSTTGGVVTWDGGVTNGVPYTPLAAGTVTYTASSTSPDDCPYSVDITVLDLPVVTASVDNDEICIGESVTFTGGGADDYVWDMGVTDGVAFTPAAVGTETYTVTGTDLTTTCENTASVDVTVHDLPVITASVDDDEICLGESITFTGSGGDTYVWDMGVTDGVPFTPAALGTVTYTVTGTDLTTNCENTATVDVTVNDMPVVTATVDNDEICLGTSVIFTGGGAEIYTWDLGVIDGEAYTPAAEGTVTYTVIGSNLDGTCENTATVDVTVYPELVITASVDDDEICLGESIIFTGGGADTYVWDLGVTDGVAFTPAAAGTVTYTVTGTDLTTTCENTATVDVTVNDLPIVTANVDDSEICLGESVLFTGGGASTYVWDLGVTNGIAFTPPTVGTFTHTVTGTNAGTGCENTADVTITVHALPTVAFTSDNTQGCVPFTVNFTSLNPGATFEWNFGDGGAATGSPVSHTYNTAGLFDVTLTVTSADGCENSATYADFIEAEAVPIANFTYNPNEIDVLNTEVNFTNHSTDADFYEWNFDDGSGISSETDPTHTFPTTGNQQYTVELTATSNYGCTSTAYQIITINDIILLFVPNTFTPDGDTFNEEFLPVFEAGLDIYDYHFLIYNRWGEIMFESFNVLNGWDGTYGDGSIAQDGVYVWQIEYGENMSDKKHTVTGHVTIVR